VGGEVRAGVGAFVGAGVGGWVGAGLLWEPFASVKVEVIS